MQALLDCIAQLTPPTEARRLFHGRGGRYPGCEHLSLDAYPPVLLLTSFAPLDAASLATIDQALAQRYATLGQALHWVYQQRGSAAHNQLMRGSIPEPHTVHEGPLRYHVRLLQGQNHGLFLDMAAGRAWVGKHIQNQGQQGTTALKVLNLFAYSCAFSVAALHAGASEVINIDMASSALALGRENHQLNHLAGAKFFAHDIFSSWGKIKRLGPYDLIIADPPSYQKGSFVATKDYARLVRRLPEMLTPNGHALLCLNAPELSSQFVRETVQAQAPGLVFVERLANPPVFADVDEERSLKVLVYRKAQA